MLSEKEIEAAISTFRRPSEYHTTLWEEMKAALEAAEKVRNKDVVRVEVIDATGRAYVNLKAKNTRFSYQDKGLTLKVFID